MFHEKIFLPKSYSYHIPQYTWKHKHIISKISDKNEEQFTHWKHFSDTKVTKLKGIQNFKI